MILVHIFRKKTRAPPVVIKKIYSAFGSSSKRDLLMTRNPNVQTIPGVGVYTFDKPQKNFKIHSLGGEIKMKPAFEIVCSPINLDTKCEICEQVPRNIYWKSQTKQTVFCRSCYNQRVFEIKKKTRGVVDKLRKLDVMENDFEKKRYCDFYHEHNKTSAAVRLLSPKTFHKRIHQENLLNTLFKY
jgi:hypothetical protein